MIIQLMINSIEKSVKNLFNELGLHYTGDLKISVEQPAHLEHGDYSTNVAMQLAKVLRKPPIQIAGMLKNKLEDEGYIDNLVNKIEVAPPGFINMTIDWKEWAQRAFTLPLNNGEKVVVEHTSINPNKSAHIGHLRNSCIGDALVRLLKRTGYNVEVHNYIDDLGNQLADTVVGLMNIPERSEHSRFGDFCWDIYSRVNKEYQENPTLLEERTKVLHSLEKGNENLSWIGLLAAERIVREHLEEMKAFGIDYDLLVWESNIVREGFWTSAFDLLRQTTLFYQETSGKLAGCWLLKQSSSDIEKNESEHNMDKVLVRSNGLLTYTAKDIAYHLWKFGLLEKDFLYKRFSEDLWTTHANGIHSPFGRADIVINVIDHRQEYPQAMVKQALEILGYTKQAEQLRHVSYGVVSLSPAAARELGIDTTDGKASYAMSGRQGIGIKISDLLDRMEGIIETKRSDKNGLSSRIIAAAAIRYYLLRYNLLTEVVFDIEQATEVTGNTGVYLVYAYARAVSILNKAEVEFNMMPEVPEEIKQMEKCEYALLRHIAAWQDTLYTASNELSLNTICNYAHELATLFNSFYAACPIMKAGEDKKAFRIWLTYKFKETIGDALTVLGLPTSSRM
ncbi:arginyl-tRNA synthetase [Scopulibacillus darangshiensis]|uniref:Arginine--tRNA ligase n=1 Tax=Scopulibacillus darangshiensis TaxID=442528 RepID=A0A4R2P2Y4_9BACL|nr:arginine--tRNA ligase [Scopulibacillus darangshiensis]TCP29070.1 arginyl-tRNA synthetase [Scopulibacillus darangshiensis]